MKEITDCGGIKIIPPAKKKVPAKKKKETTKKTGK